MHPKRPAEIFQLFASTTSLAGVGAKLASVLEKRIGQHVIDVLRHLPIGLIDRSQRPSLANIDDGTIATFDLLVISHDRPPRGVRRPYRVFCENETGALELVFFHAHDDYVAKQLPIGERRLISGRVELFQGRVQMAHPDHILPPSQASKMPVFEPIYPLTAGLTPKILRRTIADALTRIPDLSEWIPPDIVQQHGWPDFATAMRAVHAPQTAADLMPTSPVRARLAFDELLANQLAMRMVRHSAAEATPGRAYCGDGHITNKLRASLPYEMTGAQNRAIDEITNDQAKPKRMLRMLQGDVGAGKAFVAGGGGVNAREGGAEGARWARSGG